MPAPTREHFHPETLPEGVERMLIRRWQDYQKRRRVKLKELVADMSKEFDTTMKPFQVIRWRAPKHKVDADRSIHIQYVEHFARNGGVYEIFFANGVSDDEKLIGDLGAIWYRPIELRRKTCKRVVEEKMVKQVGSPGQLKAVAMSMITMREYVSSYLEVILDELGVSYHKAALTAKVRRAVADELYSVVGFDFNPSR